MPHIVDGDNGESCPHALAATDEANRRRKRRGGSGARERPSSRSLRDSPDDKGEKDRKLILVCMADVEPEEVSWLWDGRVARGKLALLVGDPGVCKSFLSLDIAARVSTGSAWPDGTPPCEEGSVILLFRRRRSRRYDSAPSQSPRSGLEPSPRS